MGLGRCFKVTLQTCAPENFRVCRWGAERRVSRAQTRERGPPSAWAEIFFFAKFFAPKSDSNLVASIKYKPLYFCQFTSILSCAGSTRMPNLSLSPASWRSLSNLYSALILYPSGDNTWLVSSPPLITACRQNPSALQNRLLKNKFHTMQYALKNLIQSKFYLAISLPESEVGSMVMILVYIVI